MLPMTSLHVNRVAPLRATSWFGVAILTTVLSVVVAAIVWSVSAGWAGLAAGVVVAAGIGTVADRQGHRNLGAFALGAVVTIVGLLAAPLLLAHAYIFSG